MERIKKSTDFKRIYGLGKVFSNRLIVLWILKNELPGSRVGFSVSKKHGGAVARNRLRRRLKEVARVYRHELPSGYDLVIVPRKAAAGARFGELVEAYRDLIRHIGGKA